MPFVSLRRMTRRLAARAALALAFLMAPQAQAQSVASMIADGGFGFGGFASIPAVDTSTPASAPLGFVRMPLSGGYLVLSVQTVSGVSRVVASRLTETGAIDNGWGSGGAQAYAIPIPTGAANFTGFAPARVVVALEGSPAIEVVYLVGLYNDGDGRPNLMAMRLGANGAFLSFANSELFGFIGGAGSIDAISPASGTALLAGHPGLLVAVRGQGSMADTTTIVQVFTPLGSVNTSIVDYATSDVRLSRPGLRINHLLAQDDGSFDAVGTEGGMALYLHYDAKSLHVLQERYFALSCGTGFGASSASVADGIVRNATSVLLLGRARCGGDGTRAVLARVATIDIAPTEVWSSRVSDAFDGFADLLDPCLSCAAVMSDTVAGQVLVVSPSGYLAHVDAGNGRVAVRDALQLMQGAAVFGVAPTTRLGLSQTPPYLTGIAVYNVPPSAPLYGLARVAVDRVFASGMER